IFTFNLLLIKLFSSLFNLSQPMAENLSYKKTEPQIHKSSLPLKNLSPPFPWFIDKNRAINDS
ncbi:MAG TPA: hypothetical protein VMU21_11095, partial [Thermodesulfovibrionales bacterium]|nr:hypothetical protein [Thermodesulfovibrionales bacterium]